jgi:hypothetical protein
VKSFSIASIVVPTCLIHLAGRPCWAVKPINGRRASSLDTNASCVALFLQVSDLDVRHLLLPLAQDLYGHIRVRRGIGHDARQVSHFFELISRTLVFGSHSPKGLGKGMRSSVSHGTLTIAVVLMLTAEGLRCSAISVQLSTWTTGTGVGGVSVQSGASCAAQDWLTIILIPRARPSTQSKTAKERT